MIEIKEDKEYFGEYITEWKPEYENKYVITGQQQGFPGLERRIGRVAQVRLEAGEFGSDNVLLRHVDNVLMQHHNQSFWLIPDKFKSYLDECFKDVDMDNATECEYTIGEKLPEKGFIIQFKIKDGESTPMRDIKNAINDKLKDL